jgi:hypothetical protein
MTTWTVIRTWHGVKADTAVEAQDTTKPLVMDPLPDDVTCFRDRGSPGLPTDMDALEQAIDILWGYFTPEQAADVREHAPEIVAMAQLVHEKLNHAST